MNRKKNSTYITEIEAARLIELPAKFFRKLVLYGSLKGVINYISSRRYSYRYNKVDFENYLYEDANFTELSF
jgi:hypothetical protein